MHFLSHKAMTKTDQKHKRAHNTYEKANFYVDRRYKIEAILGKGAYGTVCSAIDTKAADPTRQRRVAIKKVSNIFTKEVLLKRAVRELQLMRHFKGHRNIISLVDLDLVYSRPYDGLYCFQELVEYDLVRVIHLGLHFSLFHIQSFLYQILSGVKYMHSAEVIHRDLKPGNILCTAEGTLKICDFGMARGLTPKHMRHLTTTITNYVATRWYRAPELMLCRRSYGKAVDLWAVGCVFGEFYGRKPLFVGNDQIHQITEIVKVLGTPSEDVIMKLGSRMAWEFFSAPSKRYPRIAWKKMFPYISEEASELLSGLLNWDSRKRFTVEQALDHPFLAGVRDVHNEPVCDSPFDFGFENTATSLSDLMNLLKSEVDAFKLERA